MPSDAKKRMAQKKKENAKKHGAVKSGEKKSENSTNGTQRIKFNLFQILLVIKNNFLIIKAYFMLIIQLKKT